MSARTIVERENLRGASRRADLPQPRNFERVEEGDKGTRVAKFENVRENPANFQNSASYRFEFPWALLWDGPLYSSESKGKREREREEREDLSVAKLSSTSSPSRRPTTTPRDHSRYPSAERPSRPLTPVITSTNVQGIAFRDRTLEAEENANSMESPS